MLSNISFIFLIQRFPYSTQNFSFTQLIGKICVIFKLMAQRFDRKLYQTGNCMALAIDKMVTSLSKHLNSSYLTISDSLTKMDS